MIISCETKVPNCIHNSEPSIFLKISGKFIGHLTISGEIVNIGNAKARNVRIIFEFYDYPNAENKIKQLIVYTEPTILAPGEKGEYETALGNLLGDKSIKKIFSIKDKKIFQEKEKAPTLGQASRTKNMTTLDYILKVEKEKELKGKLENYKHYCYYTYTIKWD